MRTERQWNPIRIAITIMTLSVRILEGTEDCRLAQTGSAIMSMLFGTRF